MALPKRDWPVDHMIELYESGWSCEQIAAHIDERYAQCVWSVLHRHGVKTRPVGAHLSGFGNPQWKGGRHLDKDGYTMVYSPDHPIVANRRSKMVREHRLIAERILGRLLTPKEVVHHKDDDHSNNDPSNLVVYASNAEHLAQTIAGQVPNWTEEGKQKIRERSAKKRRSTPLPRSAPGDSRLQRKKRRLTAKPGIDLGALLRTAAGQPQ